MEKRTQLNKELKAKYDALKDSTEVRLQTIRLRVFCF